MQLALIEMALELLRAGKPARFAKLDQEEEPGYRALQLLTAKPALYVGNVDEASAERQRHSQAGRGQGARRGRRLRRHLGPDRRRDRPARAARIATIPGRPGPAGARPQPADPRGLPLLGLTPISPPAQGGARLDHHARHQAPQAAGVIHTDFEKGFIRAETIAYDDFVALGGEAGAKEAGKMRARRQGVRRQGRRRVALPVRQLTGGPSRRPYPSTAMRSVAVRSGALSCSHGRP